MKILLIGASGQLGTDLRKELKEELICPGREDFDVTDFERVRKFISENSFDVVINTAAFHQVDKCEEEPEKSFLVNTLSVKNLADICREKDIPLVHYSTDYVFGLDKQRKTPYIEEDPPGPVNIYGISKLAGEYYIRYSIKKYFIIRPSGLFGSAGAEGKGGNFIETMLRLAKEKGRVKVKDDEFVTPTYTRELAEVTRSLIHTESYGVYHTTSQGFCSWYEFAKKIFELTGTQVECEPVPSSNFPTLAQRPNYSVLENRHLKEMGLDKMSHWEEALKKYLIEKKYI